MEHLFNIDWSYDGKIPGYMQGGLRRWVLFGEEPGDFLLAVLNNDLRAAIERADETNINLLPVYVSFLYNECPGACWGSLKKVEAWARAGGVCAGALVASEYRVEWLTRFERQILAQRSAS